MSQTEPISEKLLHYIWQFQKFNTPNICIETGEKLQIIQIGQLNTNAGPDFLEAKIKINDIVWVGNIEIHFSAADWHNHNHQNNPAYDNVILHIVWENDRKITRKNGQSIPTLCLKPIVNKIFISDYQALINNHYTVPCQNQFNKVNSITKMLMLEKVLINRLERKANLILENLATNNNDWEQTTYQLLAKTMGFGLNSMPFERLAKIVPLKIIQKHANNLLAIEALIFGAAGFLENPADNYAKDLQKEYLFLKAKYNLTHQVQKHEWKFMRLRPKNFPTIRLAQFAQIIQHSKSMFSYFILFNDANTLKTSIKAKPSAYWQNHYNFGEITTDKLAGMGMASIENLLINAVAPLLAAYSINKGDSSYIEKAIQLLENLKSESNKITKFWDSLDFHSENAFDSQAKIELYNEYCQKKLCLSCNIGAALLK